MFVGIQACLVGEGQNHFDITRTCVITTPELYKEGVQFVEEDDEARFGTGSDQLSSGVQRGQLIGILHAHEAELGFGSVWHDTKGHAFGTRAR